MLLKNWFSLYYCQWKNNLAVLNQLLLEIKNEMQSYYFAMPMLKLLVIYNFGIQTPNCHLIQTWQKRERARDINLPRFDAKEDLVGKEGWEPTALKSSMFWKGKMKSKLMNEHLKLNWHYSNSIICLQSILLMATIFCYKSEYAKWLSKDSCI